MGNTAEINIPLPGLPCQLIYSFNLAIKMILKDGTGPGSIFLAEYYSFGVCLSVLDC